MRRRCSDPVSGQVLDSAKHIPVHMATTDRRLVQLLHKAGVRVVADIENMTEAEFMAIKGCGPKTQAGIGILMRRFQVEFADKPVAPVEPIQGKLDRPGWDCYFIDIAKAVSARAIDPSIHVGCVIVDTGRRIIATGYNGFPPGFPDDRLPRTRPEKYPYTIHAEANAVASSRADLRLGTLYCTHSPCVECAKLIITSGIRRVVYETEYATSPAALEQSDLAKKLFKMGHVTLEEIHGSARR